MSRHTRLGAPRISSFSIGGLQAPTFGDLADPGPLLDLGSSLTGFCAGISNPTLKAACEAGADLSGELFGGDEGDPIGISKKGLAAEGCLPFMTRDPITGQCRFDIDPGAGQGFPGGGDAAGGGLNRPRAVSRTVLECPRFADGKTGILWMNALTGDVVCLPRRTSGRGFGLIRKNPPRKKPFISAAQKKSLDRIKSVQDKAKKFAMDAGFSCKKR